MHTTGISGYTEFSLFGTNSNTTVDYTGISSDTWQVYNTHDPKSCCGGAAYGIDDKTKDWAAEPPYHVDIRKVFNNSKNKLYSNREKFIAGKPRIDRSRVQTRSGIPYTGDDGEVINVGEFPYYGPYYELEAEDTYLRYSRENHTTYNNGTCYTKRQELTIFPDCLVQNMPKKEYCREGEQYKQNVVPRLTFVYHPCNYNQSCEFNASGQPMTAGASGMPRTIEDLRNGYGGQEIVMHINLGDAWGTKSRPLEVCGCGDDVPPGEVYYPPEVIISSPVTFPCFPKFDLDPSGYGCQDPMWWGKFRALLDESYDPSFCEETDFNACWKRQPYTTYGYIRNICGSKNNSRVDVLKSLGALQHQADYLDTNPENSGRVEPMYVSFPRPMDDTGLGFPTGGNNGFIDENEDGIPDNSGEQQYRAYWGLTDEKGRLAFPYFRTKMDSVCAKACPNGFNCVPFVNFDYLTTLTEGFPTDAVPFLIEIDHEDYCVGCATNQIEEKEYFITIESLPAKYIRGWGTADDTEVGNELSAKFRYGYNHCRYPGPYGIPKWEIDPETNTERWLVPTGCDNMYVPMGEEVFADAEIHTDETCACVGGRYGGTGFTVPLKVHKLKGTNMPKYLSTDGGINSYVQFPLECVEPRDTEDKIMKDYTIYFAAHMHCGNLSSVVTQFDEDDNRNYGDLATLLGCGGCSHSYPATNSKPNLSLDFWYVRKGFEDYFEKYDDVQLSNGKIVDFLENGAIFGFSGPNANASPSTFPIGINSLATCNGGGGRVVMGDCYNIGDTTCSMCFNNSSFDLAANYGYEAVGFSPGCYHYRNGQRTIKLNTTVPGCTSSKIVLYGYSYFKEPSPNAGTDGGFNRIVSNGTEKCCEQNSCYLGKVPTNIPSFMFTNGPLACWACEEYKYACLGSCGALHASQDCYNKINDPEFCCRIHKDLWSPNGSPIDRPLWDNHCFAKGEETSDVIGEFHWYPETSGLITIGGVQKVSVCPEGYYGSLNACHAEIFFTPGAGGGNPRGIDSNFIVSWDGENIPGIGNVVNARVREPAARRVGGGRMSNMGISTCALDSGPNRHVKVKSEFVRPKRMIDKYGFEQVDLHLGPVECTKQLGPSIVPATCVRPIFPNKMADVAANTAEIEVVVNRETSFPEIMTVHRIECTGNGYALHVSREYYEHDRVAYATQKYAIPGSPPTLGISKYPIFGKIEGGRDVLLYEHPASAENPNHYIKICNTGDLPYDSNPLEVLDYPITIPMMARSDYHSPCYMDQSGETCVFADEPFFKTICAAHPSTGIPEGGNGSGATGHFQTDAGGCITFVIDSSGSDYFYNDADGNAVPCARAIFDNPCIGLNLTVSDDDDHKVNGYSLDYDACSIPEPEKDDPVDYCQFPINTRFDVNIVNCDANPKIVCEQTAKLCDEPDGEPIYPNFYNDGSGVPLWNFYNLVYDYHFLDYHFLTDAALTDGVCYVSALPGDRSEPFPKNEQSVGGDLQIKTGFINGSLLTNQSPIGTDMTDFTCSYSCLQDATMCGGDFFNNKEFFPRRRYKTGTKVTRYGSLSICAQNAEHSWGSWLSGHIKNNATDTMKLGGLDDIKYTNFVDPSKQGAYTTLIKDVEIDDEIIYVRELTTLLGAQHPFFKMLNPSGLDTKSCLMPDSGCFHFLPTHNDSTSRGMTEERFFSGDDVYYTNKEIIRKAIAENLVGKSGCLLNPFKIMVDVEPCNERLSHPGTSYPMNLSWVVPNVPAGVCKGWLYTRPTTCAASTCDKKIKAFGLQSVFGPSRIEKLYFCHSNRPDGPDGDGSYCSWDPIDQDDCFPIGDIPPGELCGEVKYREYHVFTGADGVEYVDMKFHEDVDTRWPAVSAGDGAPVSIDCLKSVVSDCGTIGEISRGEVCQNCEGLPPEECPTILGPVPAYPLVHVDSSEYSGADEDFCNYIKRITRFEKRQISTNSCAPDVAGPATGYRNVNLLTGDAQCAAIAEAYRDYGCYAVDGIQECPFKSVIKITITE